MAANMQFQHTQEATSDMVNAYHEITQVLADRLVTLHECYFRFAHSIFRAWSDVFTPQIPQTPHLRPVRHSPQMQQDTCHLLTSPQRRRREGNQSQVAALRERLDRECEAYNLFCHGYAVTASHAAITTRMQAFSKCVGEIHTTLVPLIGDEQTTQIVGKALQEKVT
jgi:hypothetical protein